MIRRALALLSICLIGDLSISERSSAGGLEVSLDDKRYPGIQQSLKTCREIPEDAYSTAMIFNPQGYATAYHRSRCFYNLAQSERLPSVCTNVIPRHSIFFDGSAYTEESCRKEIAAKLTKEGASNSK